MTKYSTTKKAAWLLLFLYSVLAFSIYPDMVPFRGAIMTMLVIMILLMLGIPTIINIRKCPILRYLIVILILDVTSNVVYGGNLLTHFIMAINYIALIMSLKILIDSEDSLNTALKVLFYPSFIGGPVIGLYQLLIGNYVFGPEADSLAFADTVISTVGHTNANYTAIAMLFALLLSGALAFRLKKIYYYIFAIISAICIVLTFSRTTNLFMIIFGFLFFIAAKKYQKENKRAILFIAVIVVFAVSYNKLYGIVVNYLDTGNIERILEIKQTSTMNLRTDQWKAAVEIVFSNGPIEFLLGFGDSAGEIMSSVSGRNMTAHNFFFGRLAENGIIGFLASIMLYINIFRRFFEARKRIDKGSLWIAYSVIIMLCSYMMISIITFELIISIVLFDIITDLSDGRFATGRENYESQINSKKP